eukprot:gene9686-13039_t
MEQPTVILRALTLKGGYWVEYKNIDMCGLGDVELIDDWKSKMSIDDLKRKAEENNWSAISIGDFDFAAIMKSFRYQLDASHCKLSRGYINTLYIYTPSQSYAKPSLAELEIEEEREWARLSDRCNTGGYWTRYKNIDKCGQGDKELIQNWRSTMTLEDFLRKVEENNWSAISVGDFSFAAMKSFRYQLDASHCKPTQEYTNTFYIYSRPPGYNKPPPGGCCTIN